MVNLSYYTTRKSYDALTNQTDSDPIEPILIQGPSTSPVDTIDTAPQDNRRHGRQPKASAKKLANDEPGSSEQTGQPRRSGRRA
jgi:hypothetical protein